MRLFSLLVLLSTTAMAETTPQPAKADPALPTIPAKTDGAAKPEQPTKVESLVAEVKKAELEVKKPQIESLSAATQITAATPAAATVGGDSKPVEAKPIETTPSIAKTDGNATPASTASATTGSGTTDGAAQVKTDSAAGAKTDGTPTIATTSSFTPSQKEELSKIVLEVVEKNPDVLVKAIQTFGEAQQKEMLKKESERISKFKDDLLNDKTAITGGNPNGSVKIIVFVDPNCPHCRNFESILGEVKGLFSNLKIYTRPWPIMGKESADVVTGLVAVSKLGYEKYDAINTRIATSNEKYDKAKFLKLAKEVGVDSKKLEKEMASEPVRETIKGTHELAVKMGLDATPTVILVDQDSVKLLMPTDKEALRKTLSEAKA